MDIMDGWIITLMLGTVFLIVQVTEYYESPFSFMMVYMVVHFIC